MKVTTIIFAAALAAGPVARARAQACEVELMAPVLEKGSGFGTVVGLDGDRLLATAPFKKSSQGSNTGAAYVLERSSGAWVQQATLAPVELDSGDAFGRSGALSGDTVLIGVQQDSVVGTYSGSAYVFAEVAGAWVQQGWLVPDDAAALDQFGTGVALDGDTALVGAPGSPAAYFFERSGSSWSQTARLGPPGSSVGRFAEAVALSGDTALVAQPLLAVGETSSAGGVHLYTRSGSSWTFQTTLYAADAEDMRRFGTKLAFDGDMAVIGAPHLGGGPIINHLGAAYVFRRAGESWAQEAKLQPELIFPLDQYGDAVSFDGDRVAIGAYERPNAQGVETGSVFLYEFSGTTWTQTHELTASNAGSLDDFGRAVALQGTTLVAGSPGHDHPGGLSSGSTYVYDVSAPAPVVYCTAGVSASGCQALLSASGAPSATAASGFCLTAFGVEGGKDGLFFFGANGRQASPWGNGTSFQCVAPPVKRAGLLAATGTPGACDGSFTQDLNALWCPSCPKPGHNPGAGSTVQAQLWYRDPASTSNQTTSLSDAIEFYPGP